MEEKESEFAGRILIQSSVTSYFNQRGETIAKTRGWQIRAERSAARERQKYTFEPYQYSREELQTVQEAVLNEEIRGSNARWWEDVEVGDDMTPVVKGPMSHGDITAFVAGCIGRHLPRHPANGDDASSLLGVHRPQHRRPGGHHPGPTTFRRPPKAPACRAPTTTGASVVAGWGTC